MIPRLLLDTNALSDFAEAESAIMQVLAGAEELLLPVVVVGEYRFGIAQAKNTADYNRWLERLIIRSDVLDITDKTTLHYASVRLDLKRIGKPIPMNDVWIAALCRQHEVPILSRDRHFDAVPRIKRIDW